MFLAQKQNVSGLVFFLEHTDSERSKALFAQNNVKKTEKGVGMEEKVQVAYTLQVIENECDRLKRCRVQVENKISMGNNFRN